MSILNPTATAAGSLKPAVKPTGKTFLFGLLTLVLFPFALAPSMIPLGLEIGLHWLGWFPGIPICLLLSLGEVLAVGYLYSWALDRQGELLQSRELRILDVVSRASRRQLEFQLSTGLAISSEWRSPRSEFCRAQAKKNSLQVGVERGALNVFSNDCGQFGIRIVDEPAQFPL